MLLGVMSQAAAQSTEADDPLSTENAATTNTPEEEAVGLEEIVVTVQRRSENAQRAGVPVSTITGDSLGNAGVTDVNNLTKMVPSLVVQPQGGSSTNFYMRGVGSFGTNAFAENAIAFNFAGVYLARPTSPVGTLFDLQRIEVVKGPQGTLYGRNATGGAINVIPRAPDLGRTEVDLTAEYGNYDTKKLSAAFNAPLGNTFAVRLAGQAVKRDGYLSDGSDDEEGQAARASLLFEPSDNFSTVLIADYFHQDGRGVGSVLVPGATAPTAPPIEQRIAGSDPRSVAELRLRFPAVRAGAVAPPLSNSFVDSTFYGVTLVTEADLGFATLTVLPAYRRSEPDFLTYNNGFLARVSEKDDQYSFEARLASNGDGAVNYVVGGYYFNERQDAENTFSQGAVSTTIFSPLLKTESTAVFGQLTFAVSERFRLVGGARYTDEHKTLSTPLRQLTPATPNPPPTFVTGDLPFDEVTWKAGVEFDATDRSLIYANAATGFKAGGFFVAAIDNTFLPEELTAYTIGSKNRFLDNRLQFNAELFYWDYKDQQVSFVGPAQYAPAVYGPGGITVNAGNARIQGVDLDVLAQPTDSIRIGVNVQYLDLRYKSFVYTAFSGNGAPVRSGCAVSPNTSLPVNPPARLFAVDCSGQSGLNAPEWSANLSYEQEFAVGADLNLILGARSRIETSRYLALDYLPEERQGNYTMSDIYMTLEGPDDHWSFTGFVNNVEDETVLASATQRQFIPVVYSALRPPRTYGLRVAFHY